MPAAGRRRRAAVRRRRAELLERLEAAEQVAELDRQAGGAAGMQWWDLGADLAAAGAVVAEIAEPFQAQQGSDDAGVAGGDVGAAAADLESSPRSQLVEIAGGRRRRVR